MTSGQTRFKRPRPMSYEHVYPDEEVYYLGELQRARVEDIHESSRSYTERPSLQKVQSTYTEDFDRTPSPPGHTSGWKSGPTDKLLLLPATLIPLLASAVLLVATITDKQSTGHILALITGSRATAQIIVSIISAILSYFNVDTITRLLNLGTRIHLLRQSLTLDVIKFIEAITTRNSVLSISSTISMTSLTIVLLFAIPSVLWTGALTPVIINAAIVSPNVLKIPQYSNSSNATWSNANGNYITVRNSKGVFSSNPIQIIESDLLIRTAQASSNLSYPKVDNSHYSYTRRSYGVGSPAGLVDENLYGGLSSSTLLSYNYTEPGYLTSVKCFYNASSDWHLEEIQEGKIGNGIPFIYYATGLFPNADFNSSPDFFAVVGMGGDSVIAAMSAKTYSGRNVILITAGSDYPILNGTQCEVVFTPTEFAVSVDVTNKVISVVPVKENTSIVSFDPTIGLADNVIDQVNGLGGTSTTLYTSVVADALMSNIDGAFNNTSTSSPETTFDAMADSFEAIIDELLLFAGSSQFFVPKNGIGDFSTVDAVLTVQAVKFGEAKYVFPTFAMCALLLVVAAVEAYRTRLWKSLPKWDFIDTTCLVIASAVACKDILAEICQDEKGRQMDWTGAGSGG